MRMRASPSSAAKEVSRVLSNGGCSVRDGPSPYNRIFEFPYKVQGAECQMSFTSVSGHLMNLDFPADKRKWHTCNPRDLIDGVQVNKIVSADKEQVAENLRREARKCAWLILWLGSRLAH